MMSLLFAIFNSVFTVAAARIELPVQHSLDPFAFDRSCFLKLYFKIVVYFHLGLHSKEDKNKRDVVIFLTLTSKISNGLFV